MAEESSRFASSALLAAAKNVEHAVVYRRENEFASHPYVRGFWETGAGHLICNFSLATVDYRGDPNAAGAHQPGAKCGRQARRRPFVRRIAAAPGR